MDQLNEFLNLWFKSCVPNKNFDAACSHMKGIMLLRKCSYETFGRRETRTSTVFASQEPSIEKLVQLFEKADLFPLNSSVERKMHPNFFWNLVDKPEKAGTEKDKENEEATRTPMEKALFARLCMTEGERDVEFGEFEDPEKDDDEDISIVSSCMGSVSGGDQHQVVDETEPADAEEWENLDEKEREVGILDGLKKHCGNVKKKGMHDAITKDFLGADGDVAMEKVKETHEKNMAKNKRKFDMIQVATTHFEQKMKTRRTMLQENTAKSMDKTYSRKKYWWKERYKQIMKAKKNKK